MASTRFRSTFSFSFVISKANRFNEAPITSVNHSMWLGMLKQIIFNFQAWIVSRTWAWWNQLNNHTLIEPLDWKMSSSHFSPPSMFLIDGFGWISGSLTVTQGVECWRKFPVFRRTMGDLKRPAYFQEPFPPHCFYS